MVELALLERAALLVRETLLERGGAAALLVRAELLACAGAAALLSSSDID